MEMLSEVYSKSLAANEKNLHFWETYLLSLKTLDLSIYIDKLKVPTLVPIGSRISFRGEFKHTNEVTVALGASYFAKCSVKQAEVLRQRRIKDAQSKVDMFKKEQSYLESQIFSYKTLYDNKGLDIVEYISAEDDKEWREAHRENVKKYIQNKGKEEKNNGTEEVTDEDLWNRLEELELKEEMENELSSGQDTSIIQHVTKGNASSVKEVNELEHFIETKNEAEKINQDKTDSEKETKITFGHNKAPEKTTKLDILQQVIDKQNKLEKLLIEAKQRARCQVKNETDLRAKLDELEQLDELEDEMDRLEDIIENEDMEEEGEDDDENTNLTEAPKLNRRVSFVDEDDSNTLEIPFKHSPVESNNEPYNPTIGIQKPSDIYDAHSNLFGNGFTSILKKSKYEAGAGKSDTPEDKVVHTNIQAGGEPETIVLKDVVEKVTEEKPKELSQARPTSLFKKRRMQKDPKK